MARAMKNTASSRTPAAIIASAMALACPASWCSRSSATCSTATRASSSEWGAPASRPPSACAIAPHIEVGPRTEASVVDSDEREPRIVAPATEVRVERRVDVLGAGRLPSGRLQAPAARLVREERARDAQVARREEARGEVERRAARAFDLGVHPGSAFDRPLPRQPPAASRSRSRRPACVIACGASGRGGPGAL